MKGYPVELIGHSGAVYGLSFDANDQYLLSCSEDQTGAGRFVCVLAW